MFFLSLLIIAVAGYLLGSINFAIVVSKFVTNVDIREYGSKNAGATNVIRTLGKKWGVVTAVGDIIKAMAAVAIGFVVYSLLCNDVQTSVIGAYTGGFFAMVGHIFPLYYRFKGGKGVATLCGTILCLNWRAALIMIFIFVLVILISKMVSLASVIGVSLFAPLSIIFSIIDKQNVNIAIFTAVVSFLFSVIVIWKHKENLAKIANGTERKIGQRDEIKSNKSTIF